MIQTDRAGAEAFFNEYIKEQIVLDNQGYVKEGVNAFDVDLAKELKRTPEEQNFPLYIAEVDGETYYIIPLRGAGLWNAIFGYIALKNDVNTIKGQSLTTMEKPRVLELRSPRNGLEQRFTDEKIFDENGELIGVSVVKGTAGASKDDNKVDAISGATITGDGVSVI